MKIPNIDHEFDLFWQLYDYKVGRLAAQKSWKRLRPEEREAACMKVEEYVASTPDKQYRKHPATWLNGHCWEDEIVHRVSIKSTPPPSPTLKPWLS